MPVLQTVVVPTLAQNSAAQGAPAWLSYTAVAIAAASVAVSLLLGLSNHATAQRALRLSERQEARRDAPIDIYLNESVAWRSESNDDRVLGFHVMVSNPTDRANSLVLAELHVSYEVDGVVTTLKVPNAEASAPAPTGVDPVALPFRLEANAAVGGWLLFRMPRDLTGRRQIDRYDLVLRDIHGLEEIRQVTIFREGAREQAD